MRATLAASLLIFCATEHALAQSANCAAVTDDKERLACYDDAAQKHATPQRAELPSTPDGRAQFADNIRRSLLSRGADASAWVYETKRKDAVGIDPLNRFPLLIVFAPLNNSSVFQLAGQQGKILEIAHRLGFKGVQFNNKFGGGSWWFDLSGKLLPQCDISKRVCL